MVPIMLLSMVPVTASAEVEPIVTDNFAFIPNSADASVSKVNLDPGAPPVEVARYSTIEPRPGAYNLADYRVSRLAIDGGGNAWALNTMTGQGFPGFSTAQGSVARINADPVAGEVLGTTTSNSSTIVSNDVRVTRFNLGAPGDGPRTISIVEEAGTTYLWIGFYVSHYFEKYAYDADAGTLTAVPGTKVDVGTYTPYSAALDQDGIMWVSSRNASPYPSPAGTPGVIRFDTNNPAGGYQVLPYEVSGNNPYAIIVDSDGKAWVSDGSDWGTTKVRTFAVYDDSGGPVTVEYVPTTGAPSQAMRGFIEYEGAIWASAIDGQVLKGTPGTPWTWEVVKSGLGELTGIGPDAFGYLWVVQLGNDSIYRFDPGAPNVDNISVGVGDQPYAYGNFVVTVQYAELGDYVWEDLNRNGIQDAGEPGIEGVTVNLHRCDGEFVKTTMTDADGKYLFEDLLPGDYKVEFVLPDGFVFTMPDQGGDDAVDSDADPLSGMTICTSLAAGETDLTWDAGMYRVYDFCGYKWLGDTDTGLAGWEIELYKMNDAGGWDYVKSAITAAEPLGKYCFTDLPAGTYKVSEVLKPGWTQLSPNPNEHIVVLPKAECGVNLVVNGDFEGGNMGFTSEYDYVTVASTAGGVYGLGSLDDEGLYALGIDPALYHELWSSFYDHTKGDGTGTMMIINGNKETGIDPPVLYETTVDVGAYCDYEFSFWAATSYPAAYANIDVYINDEYVDTFNAPDTLATWGKFSTMWSSGSATSATIKLVDVNTAQTGNDFALDDISLCATDCAYDFRNVPQMECFGETAMAAHSPGVFRFVPAPGNWFTYIKYNMDDQYTADAPRVYPIYAGQTNLAGELDVYDAAGKVYVRYRIFGGANYKAGYCGEWAGISEYHLQVVDQFAGFNPYRTYINKKSGYGSIIPGQLTDKGYFEEKTADTGWIMATTGPLSGEVYIAAHSVAWWCGYPCANGAAEAASILGLLE
jgi:streptogramin lyase